jgi:hypothetical protein
MKRKRIPVALCEDETAWLSRLSPRQIGELSDEVWNRQRKSFISGMNEASIDSCDRVALLVTLDEDRGKFSKLLQHAVTVNGANEILEKACSSDNAENAENLLERTVETPTRLVVIACDLLGHELEEDDNDSPPVKSGEG